MMLLGVLILDVVGDFAKPDGRRAEILWHLFADAALIPPLNEECLGVAFSPYRFPVEFTVGIAIANPPDAAAR